MRDRFAEKNLVKERIRIEDLVKEVVPDLAHKGSELWGCCPFHAEETASFHVRPGLGLYKCFGCQESGDVFSFVMKTRGVDFVQALQLLAERAGVELSSYSDEDRKRHAETRRRSEVMATALKVFRQAMGGPGRDALEYMKARGFERETLLDWAIGFIPEDFTNQLRRAGLESRDIDAAGFTRQFAGRLGFGIRDAYGTIVGFGARRLNDEQNSPKYVNTRETATFSKARLLYGLDKASAALGRTGRLVVMEGYTDVMMAHQQGLDEAVATMGTSFTAQHLELVKSRVSNLVLVFDGDEAGLRAGERAVRMLLEAGRECRALLLPEGTDPGDWFTTHGRDDFETFLEAEGLSTVRFLCRRGLSQLDKNQPGGREMVGREVLGLSGTLIDPVRRDAVVADIARECGLDRNLLRSGTMVSPPPPADAVGTGRPVNAHVKSQFAAVAGLISEPDCLEELDELVALGALVHPSALRLLELGRQALPSSGCLDPMDWKAVVADEAPGLLVALDRLLFPPRDVILPGYTEAVTYLKSQAGQQRIKASRLEALSQPDVASNESTLREIEAGLRRAKSPSSETTTSHSGPENDQT